MATRNFCITLCAALAAAPALAMVPGTVPAPTGGTAPLADPAPRQFTETISFDGSAFGKPAALAGTDGANGAMGQLAYAVGDIVLGPFEPGDSQPMPEPGKLPLLGAAGVALLIAQLRRSRRPTVR